MADDTTADDISKWLKAIEQVKAAFGLPAVQQEILAQEATELCEQVDAWLAAMEEEKANG